MSEAVPADQIPARHGLEHLPNGNIQMLPVIYPVLVPGLFHVQNDEQVNRGAGLYAVPVLPFSGPIGGVLPNNLIPLTYSVPIRRSSSNPTVSDEHRQAGEGQQQQQAVPQRQVVVRRIQIAIHLDLLLILKLAAVIFLFNQDGSRQRLALLVFLASLVYLYQTGALSPFIRWLSQGMQRAAAPPRPAARAEVAPLAAGLGNENVVLPEGAAAVPASENEQQPQVVEADEDENGGNNNRWWGIVKEIQMIVFGFITSLLPGFQNVD
ncbi:uncharacterized protein LOC124940689 [Impatiens glandulifera]|uniref:uncharacterized protein LOC124940689 n=1 Tax=Impatiens glandulifera TaxID=253017 RepID=UPI001FB11ED7|nr:uncharacterized protein LOC124940689 [Impatiens glandulifera]